MSRWDFILESTPQLMSSQEFVVKIQSFCCTFCKMESMFCRKIIYDYIKIYGRK